MPFERPSLDTLRAQAKADLAAALPGSDPLLPVSNLGILGDLQAEGFNANYAYLDWIARQSVPFTATDEAFEGWAALKGVVRKPAVKARAQGVWAATPGAILPAGTQVVRSDGVSYVTTAEAVAGGGGTITAPMEAMNAGAAGTLATGSAVVISQAVAGISSAGTATSLSPGVDVEDFEAFRTRTLGVYAAPPQGGAASDYEIWAREVAGVTRAWCAPNAEGPGTVRVYFMMDDVRADDGGFPQGSDGVAAAETRDVVATGDQLAVADYVFVRQPVTALVFATAPLANTVTFTINLAGATAAIRAAVEAAIEAAFLAFGKPGGVVNNSDIEDGISAIAGTAGFVITDCASSDGSVSPGAAGNITSDAGYLPVRGLVTWTP